MPHSGLRDVHGNALVKPTKKVGDQGSVIDAAKGLKVAKKNKRANERTSSSAGFAEGLRGRTY